MMSEEACANCPDKLKSEAKISKIAAVVSEVQKMKIKSDSEILSRLISVLSELLLSERILCPRCESVFVDVTCTCTTCGKLWTGSLK